LPSYANSDLLVTADWLAANLSNPNVRVVDTRGAARYAEGHIPGATNLPVARLDDPTHPIRSMPLPPERMAMVFGNAGLANGQTIVLYDDGPGLMAARLFWVLEYYGHEKLGILDGGLARWLAENHHVTRDPSQVTASTYTPHPHPDRLSSSDDVKAVLGKPGVALLDVRSHEEYTGAMVQAARGGHVPGAKNCDWQTALAGLNIPALKSADELAAQFAAAGVTPDKQVITYCQGGVRAAHSYYVLRLLGYTNVSNYTGSWGDWGNDPNLPVEN